MHPLHRRLAGSVYSGALPPRKSLAHDKIQMTGIKEFIFPDGDPLVDETVSSDRTEFQF